MNRTPTSKIYTLSLHDALPIYGGHHPRVARHLQTRRHRGDRVADLLRHPARSEEHTSELQSQSNLVCRLLLEKKKSRTSSLASSSRSSRSTASANARITTCSPR